MDKERATQIAKGQGEDDDEEEADSVRWNKIIVITYSISSIQLVADIYLGP